MSLVIKSVLGLLVLVFVALIVLGFIPSRPPDMTRYDRDASIRRSCEQMARDGRDERDACVASVKANGHYTSLILRHRERNGDRYQSGNGQRTGKS